MRAHFDRSADEARAAHYRLYPHYRYKPVKRADKLRLRQEAKEKKDRERKAIRDKRESDKKAKKAASFQGNLVTCLDIPDTYGNDQYFFPLSVHFVGKQV